MQTRAIQNKQGTQLMEIYLPIEIPAVSESVDKRKRYQQQANMHTAYLDVKPGFSSMQHNELDPDQRRISKQLTLNVGRLESLTPLTKKERFSVKINPTEEKKRIA